jgi:HAMP domain-containing protein/putative methionine-R-sulfoxide reductase with GAF domain
MRDFLLGLKIRIKLLAAFGSLLLLSVLLIALSVSSIHKIIHYKSINEKMDVLKLRLETLDLATKEFIYEGYKSKSFLETQKTSSMQSFNENYTEAKAIIAEVQSTALKDHALLTQNLISPLDSLQHDFNLLVSLLGKRGFKDFGLEGSLRDAIHTVENSGFEFDKVTMLMLRRHEKDFFLRKDVKYQQEFNKRFDILQQQIQLTSNTALLASLGNYKDAFNKVVAIEQQIGLSNAEGIRGRILANFQLIRPRIEAIRSSIKKQNETEIARTQWMLWMIFSVQIIAGIGMALLYAGLLTKSIKEIRAGMQKLASGIFPDKLRVHTTEEIGQTKIAFNQFIDRLRAASSFAEHLGSGELTYRYHEQYANDVLAQSLISAQQKLRHAEEQQRKINWMNEGAARFNEILKNDSEEISVLGDRILKLIVYYLQANQGALYILKGSADNGILDRIATYAYDKKKYIHERISAGTGLIGQCVLEGETIHLTDIPKNYIRITSGLGEATPRHLVIVPLKTRGEVNGIIELASFQPMEQHHIEFIERMAENIASLLANNQASREHVYSTPAPEEMYPVLMD